MVEVQQEYYLPDIIKDVVERVNEFFENRVTDPFIVHFDHGLYEQVGNDRLKAATTEDVLVWLQMPFDEDNAKDESYATDVTCRLLIAIDTDSNYTMEQRETINFFPRLIPVYERLKYELQNEPRFSNQFRLDHKKRFIPYWGGGDVAGPGQSNLWKQFVDGYDISNIKLKKEIKQNCTPFTNIN